MKYYLAVLDNGDETRLDLEILSLHKSQETATQKVLAKLGTRDRYVEHTCGADRVRVMELELED